MLFLAKLSCFNGLTFPGSESLKQLVTVHLNYRTFKIPVHLLIMAAPVAKWLKTLIFSALNCSLSHRCGFEPSSGHVRRAKFCLGAVRCFFWGSPVFDLPYD